VEFLKLRFQLGEKQQKKVAQQALHKPLILPNRSVHR